jgi:hypothetical protein
MTESSYPDATQAIQAREQAAGHLTRTDGLGNVYVKTFINGRQEWTRAS